MQRTLWPMCPHCRGPVLSRLPHIACIRLLRCPACKGPRSCEDSTICERCDAIMVAFTRAIGKMPAPVGGHSLEHLDRLAERAAAGQPLFEDRLVCV
jgi:hypothetical protein